MSAAFHSLKVAEIRREIDDAVSLAFELPDALAETFAFTPGQHLTLRAQLEGEDLRRNYSICSAPHENRLRVAIKQVPGGRVSGWINQDLAVGDILEVMAPHGNFTYGFDPARAATYVAFAAGSGITPILSLLKSALTIEPGSRFVLLYGNRASNSIMFLEELADLKNVHIDRLQVFHFLSEEAEDVDLFNGRLDAARAGEAIGALIDPAGVTAAFVCGPSPMMDAAQDALLAAGVPASVILSERFSAAELSADQLAQVRALEQKAAGLKVQVSLEGRRRRIAFDPDKGSILENARAAGMPAPYACKAGVCATCRAKVVQGKVEMKTNYGLSPEEVAQGYVLTCQAVPLTEDVVLDYDA